MPRLIHYSAEPLTKLEPTPHGDNEYVGGYKTRGLWVSVEGEYDWLWWCKAEEFGLDRFEYAAEIILAADANVLTIDTVEGIDAFTAEYQIPLYPGASRHAYTIDWPRVREKYQGVIIAPYQWDRRMDPMWYYCWDCASGVIWDSDAIQAFKPIAPPDIGVTKEQWQEKVRERKSALERAMVSLGKEARRS